MRLLMATEVILIRHGYTIPVNGDYAHAPLTILGQQQAVQTGQYLSGQKSLNGFFSSPVRRAKETAAIIGEKIGATPTIKNGTQEVEGLEVPLLTLMEVLSILDPVEDYLDVRAGRTINWPIEGRVAKALLEIVGAYPGKQVALVTHSGVISSVLAWAFPEQRLKWWLTTVQNCSLTRLHIADTGIELLAVNDTQHLASHDKTNQPPSSAVRATKQLMKTVEPPRRAIHPNRTNQS
jgi:probable phosphoglycerate mutase